ncbi:hypothetical protein C482_19911 [Natrialba chahannaoensis JCM 10990]|uniref:Uncharacterized protein n=1 Tax=Natrialba chahannaoensis JCM 10990 TaxID=1227492 RepID=M0A3C1_9EURY|nr:hypothetical protein [Natrialba chahannaoensis]ELY93270.1 hypothetical protein C482_19911 [Natrialba chahannaoensis JCM 10990]
MPTQCTYCAATVPDDEYENHLVRAHADDLSRIDRRRVGLEPIESASDPNSNSSTPQIRTLAVYASAGLVLLLVAVGYGLVFLDTDEPASAAAVQPDPTAQIHEHGQVTVQYDDTVVDFNEPQYIEADECFHFHATDDATVWHAHCEDVTIEYALETLGMEVTTDRFVIGEQEFDEADGDAVSVTVDGVEVDPQEYVLQGVGPVADAQAGAGDNVEIVAESGG